MTPLFFAWALGEGIIFWRWGKAGAPPTPGVLAMSTGLFLGLAVLAEYRPARPAVTAFAFAVDLAILLQVVGKGPQQVTGWPPAYIDNPGVILPPGAGGSSAAAAGSGSAAASGTGGQASPTTGFTGSQVKPFG